MFIQFRFMNGDIYNIMIPQNKIYTKDLKEYFCEREEIQKRVKLTTFDVMFLFQCFELEDDEEFRKQGVGDGDVVNVITKGIKFEPIK